MPLPDRIEGLAIVSADGMIADATGVQPPSLRLEADQRFFFDFLDRSAALAHGRYSGEGGPGFAGRRRLILTRTVHALAPDPSNPRAVLWNPAGASLEQAWTMLGLAGGRLAIIGGSEVFGLFLPRYHVFHLSRTENAKLRGGRPVFPGIPPETPEQLLAGHGLKPDGTRVLDADAALSLTAWRR